MRAEDHRLRGRNVVKVYFTPAFSLSRNSTWRRSQVSPKFGDCGECFSVSFPLLGLYHVFLYSQNSWMMFADKSPDRTISSRHASSPGRSRRVRGADCIQTELWSVFNGRCELIYSSVSCLNPLWTLKILKFICLSTS